MNLDACYSLATSAALRPERFGGLVYRHDTRRLYFLHSPELVAFLSSLDPTRPLGTLLDEFIAARALSPAARGVFVRALSQLAHLNLLTPVVPPSH